MKKIARSAIVEHSAAEMYRLVEDIESYPQFLPWCVAAQVHERSGTQTRATLTAGLRGLRQAFTTLNSNRPGEAIDLARQGQIETLRAAIAEAKQLTVDSQDIKDEKVEAKQQPHLRPVKPPLK